MAARKSNKQILLSLMLAMTLASVRIHAQAPNAPISQQAASIGGAAATEDPIKDVLEKALGMDLDLPVPAKRLPIKWVRDVSGYDPEQVRQIEAFDPNNLIPKSWDYPRKCYLPFIQAARAAKDAGKKSTFTVDGVEYRIKYVSGDVGNDLVWGKDEEVIYVTGSTSTPDGKGITVYPGTVILMTAHQNENGFYNKDVANHPNPLNCEKPEYTLHHITLQLGTNAKCIGTRKYPVIVTSDGENVGYRIASSYGGVWRCTIVENGGGLQVGLSKQAGAVLNCIGRKTGYMATCVNPDPETAPKTVFVGNFEEDGNWELLSPNSAIPSLSVGHMIINSMCGAVTSGKACIYYCLFSGNYSDLGGAPADGNLSFIAHFNNFYHLLSNKHLAGRCIETCADVIDHGSSVEHLLKPGQLESDPGSILKTAFGGENLYAQQNFYAWHDENTLRKLISDKKDHPWSKTTIHWKPYLRQPVVLPSAENIAEIVRRYWATDETDLLKLDQILMGKEAGAAPMPGSQPATQAAPAASNAAIQQADALMSIADKAWKDGKYDDAITAAKAALTLKEGVLPKDHPDILAIKQSIQQAEQQARAQATNDAGVTKGIRYAPELPPIEFPDWVKAPKPITEYFPGKTKEEIDQHMRTRTDFVLDEYVAWVLSDPRVPRCWDPKWEHYAKWQRESYLPIIDAAREARLKHGNPYLDGNTSNIRLPATEDITVPGNLTGKSTLRIRYVSGSVPQAPIVTWGKDEDIIYITGWTDAHKDQTLVILPGTIVLVSAFQDDQRDGSFTPEMSRQFTEQYKQIIYWFQKKDHEKWWAAKNALVEGICLRQPWERRLCQWQVNGTLIARGDESRPIVMFSDAHEATPFDFYRWALNRGIIDRIVSEDSNLSASGSPNTITARCKFGNRGESHTGTTWIIGNYLGDCFHECVSLQPGSRCAAVFNVFNNRWCAAMSISDGGDGRLCLDARHNTFVNNRIGFINDASERTTVLSECRVTGNNFIRDVPLGNDREAHVAINHCQYDVRFVENYIGTLNTPMNEKRLSEMTLDARCGFGKGMIIYEHNRTSPSPLAPVYP